MRRNRFAEDWRPGEAGGYFIPVDPKKTRAEWERTRPPRVHRTKWLCVDCLKSFKDAHADRDQDRRRCPSCAGLAVRVGVRFRPPRLSDLKSWKTTLDFLDAQHWRGDPELRKRARAALAARRSKKRKVTK